MTTVEHAHAVLTAAGYIVKRDPMDAGILRAFGPARPTYRAPGAPPEPIRKLPLVGLVVIRNDEISYAEHAGRLFVAWPNVDGPTARRRRGVDWALTVQESAAS